MFDGSLIQNRNLNKVPSKRRNPILADVFTQFGYMEKRGSGLRKICNETAKLPGFSDNKRPTFHSQYESFLTEILNNNYEQENSDVVENVVESVVENVVEKIISYIENDKFITAKTLSEKLSLSSRQVQRIMTQLKTDNKIKRIGGDKGGYWEVVKEYDEL